MSSLKDHLAGTWQLVSLEITKSDGSTVLPLGSAPAGTFMFDAAGNFSSQLTDPSRAHESVMPRQVVALEDNFSSGYTASFGTYEVPDSNDRFYLEAAHSLASSNPGSKTLRHVRIADGVTVFSSEPTTENGLTIQLFATWRKIAG